jgi:glucose-6-phosphate 1-dehydrogenase
MEPPMSMVPADLQDAREAVIAAFRPLDPDDVVRGQYDGYRDVDGVAADSQTETFVAARLWIDTERWRGVPFVLRTGKRMARSAQQVTLVMRDVTGPLETSHVRFGNRVWLSLAGPGRIELDLVVNTLGPQLELTCGNARLDLNAVPAGDPLPPYATLLRDVLLGDRSLFTSREGLRSAWRAAAPLLADRPPVQPYPQGSWGPDAADRLPITGWARLE